MLAMQLAMMQKWGAMTVARAAATGPYGAIQAGLTVAETIAFSAMTVRKEQKAKEFWRWSVSINSAPLTDLTGIGDDTVNGIPRSPLTNSLFATRIDFVDRSVNKSTGLLARLDMEDPQMRSSMHIDNSHDNIGHIEIPACMAK